MAVASEPCILTVFSVRSGLAKMPGVIFLEFAGVKDIWGVLNKPEEDVASSGLVA